MNATEYIAPCNRLAVTWDGDEWIAWHTETFQEAPLDEAIADEELNSLSRDTPAHLLDAEELEWLRAVALEIDPDGTLRNRERE